ncbi:MAG: sulfotransferase [Planctomycetota bacterium]
MSRRILFLQHPGSNSRDIFGDIIEGYREAGHEVFILELGPLWNKTQRCEFGEAAKACTEMFTETILGFVWANRIDLCVSLWANGPLSLGDKDGGSFFEYAKLPMLMHWLDAPHWAHSGTVLDVPASFFNGPNSFHVINNVETAKEMKGVLGFSNILPLSNAASPRSFRPYPAKAKDFDIVLAIGADNTQPTDLMLRELANDEPDMQAIRADMARAMQAELCEIVQQAWGGRPGLEQFVESMLQARLACRDEGVLNQIARLSNENHQIAPAVMSLLQNPKCYVRFSMKLREMENWERAFSFAYLTRHFRCATFGLEEPFKDWPGTWEYLGSLPYGDQSKAYGRGWFGLNVMRWQDDVGLNLKPFEITLSGTCLLQSYRVGMEQHFDDSQAVVFRTPQECRRTVAKLLKNTDGIDRMAAAGRARSLSQHCWKHRAAEITQALFGKMGRAAPKKTPDKPRNNQGEGQVFLLGSWRSGTTLLRKILDSHTQIHAPAETWFLLPLVDMWCGEHAAEGSPSRQAAAAIQGHLDFDQFLECCRAFAANFYQARIPPEATYYVDKTPFYLRLADLLPRLFPEAKFIVLTRDPRGTVWSQHTWKHIDSPAPEGHFESVAEDNRVLDKFLQAHPDRTLHVQYEQLCTEPESAARVLCEFLNLPYESGMIDYGLKPHHEGYGDEKTREHDRPHVEAVRRWSTEDGLTIGQQAELARACGKDVLIRLGYPEYADLAQDRETAAAACASSQRLTPVRI